MTALQSTVIAITYSGSDAFYLHEQGCAGFISRCGFNPLQMLDGLVGKIAEEKLPSLLHTNRTGIEALQSVGDFTDRPPGQATNVRVSAANVIHITDLGSPFSVRSSLQERATPDREYCEQRVNVPRSLLLL